VADRPLAPMLAPPLGWRARAGSRGEGRSRSEGGDILPLGRLAAYLLSHVLSLPMLRNTKICSANENLLIYLVRKPANILLVH
jgi:hypothetical protein